MTNTVNAISNVVPMDDNFIMSYLLSICDTDNFMLKGCCSIIGIFFSILQYEPRLTTQLTSKDNNLY